MNRITKQLANQLVIDVLHGLFIISPLVAYIFLKEFCLILLSVGVGIGYMIDVIANMVEFAEFIKNDD